MEDFKIDGIRIEPAQNGCVLEVSICYPKKEDYGARYETKRRVFTKDNLDAMIPVLKKMISKANGEEEMEEESEGEGGILESLS